MDPDHVEAPCGRSGRFSGATVRNPELRRAAGADLLVVAGADAGVDAETDPPVVAPFGQPVKGIDRTDRDGQVGFGLRNPADVVEVPSRRVDRGVVESVAAEAGRERAVDLASGGALRAESGLADRFEDGSPGVCFHRVSDVGVGESDLESLAVRSDAIEVLNVQRRLVVGSQLVEAVGVPVAHAADQRADRRVRVPVAHSRRASSRCVASSVSSSTWVATTAGLYAPPSNSSWSPTDDSTIRVNARRSAGRWP